ncbi:twin-arginine translocase subunit TatC [Rubrobacter calidifluminis]|uniref:twin-arginine translocase subunit TatC n=1 Tax=Rubrobacter calidifluminis TaxID=1392640 RepID=UPI00235E2041|nr:twin-arginine translocase subunit TatC [Rubrobacter calidifluminis]
MAGNRLRALARPRDEKRMTLIEHLEELRSRIIKVGVAFVVATVVAWFFRVQIYDWLLAPSGLKKLHFTGVTAPVFTDLKLALYTAFVVTLPILIYQAWAFVAPAVGEAGRIFTYVLIGFSSLLFIAGIGFAYYAALPVALHFLLHYAPNRYTEIITADTYLSFVTRFLLAFGIVFEFPAATFVGAKLGLVDGDFLKKYRRHAVVIIAVVAAALTPTPDPFTMLLMMAPMLVMYEASILIARYVNPATAPPEPDSGSENEEELERSVYGDDDR